MSRISDVSYLSLFNSFYLPLTSEFHARRDNLVYIGIYNDLYGLNDVHNIFTQYTLALLTIINNI